MGFQVSPGVNVTEIDLTTVVPAVSSTEGAIAGPFRWGPVEQRILVDSEVTLASRFQTPTNFNAETFFTAANFLAYGNKLYVSRVVSDDARNAVSANASGGAVSGVLIKNDDDFEDGVVSTALIAAKFPGALGNSLQVEICDSPVAFANTIDISTSAIAQSNSDANTDLHYTMFTSSENTSFYSINFTNGSNAATVTVTAGNTATTNSELSDALDAVVSTIQVGSLLKAGNGSIGEQYLEVASIGDNISDTYNESGYAFDGTQAEASGTIALGIIDTVTIDNAGTGYETAPTVTVTGGGGNGAVITATVDAAGTVDSLTIVNGGSGYATTPTITIGTPNATYTAGSRTINLKSRYTLAQTFTSETINQTWKYQNSVDGAPSTTAYTAGQGGSGDELHVLVIDQDGEFTGVPGTILERFAGLSRATDAKNESGETIYYKTVLNNLSNWIYILNEESSSYSNTAINMTALTGADAGLQSASLTGGVDGSGESTMSLADYASGYDLYSDPADIDVSLILAGRSTGGTHGEALFNYIIDNICEVRKDCVVFGSPQKADSVNNKDAADDIVEFRNVVRSSSYAMMDSGYKYQYDKYNDIYRWIPLNGDVAGLVVRTDDVRDPWFSPGGFNRGQIKNVVKLGYNPRKAFRDVLYKAGVNPVVAFPGQGTVLFGDKTLLAKPSAFDRINVRRLFIVLEKAIATAAKFTLFEFNDEFTRAQFVNLVEPFLRDVQGRRGIYDFRVVCDESNNTGEVIDRNEFIGDIYIKPARSINFIQLNFVAVRTGVEFSEVVGKF